MIKKWHGYCLLQYPCHLVFVFDFFLGVFYSSVFAALIASFAADLGDFPAVIASQ